MRHELQQVLFNAAPALCSSEDFKPYGFGIPDGWFGLMLEAVEELAEIGPGLRLAQVKIKWGGLCIYLHEQPVGCDQIIHRATTRASRECQICGASTRRPDYKYAVIGFCTKHNPN